MEFRIADTFTDSLTRLTADEQKGAKTTAFDLQTNPALPSLSLHRIEQARDKNFWSARVSQDVRIIVHRADEDMLLCYVGHHDDAYRWAARRKLETHPRTGAAQLVEIRETIREIEVPVHVPAARPPLFANRSDEELLAFGIPAEWLADVQAANDDSILELANHLPKEAAEALLELAVGGAPQPAVVAEPSTNPFEHPDAQRRFRLLENVEELERALEFAWDKWTIFLHPAQRQFVESDFNGAARVGGTAGTGKTIVALHRAVYLAKQNEDARILLATFSPALANRLRSQVHRLISNQPQIAERLEVHAMDAIGQRLHELNIGPVHLSSRVEVRDLLNEVSRNTESHSFSLRFLLTEWEEVVDAWQIGNWEAYRTVQRLGRKTRLPEAQRQVLWSMFERVLSGLESAGKSTPAQMFTRLADHYSSHPGTPFSFVVVDEAQDVSIVQLRFLAALAGQRPNGLFFAGDLGQRIFQQPFSWKSLGVDVRGRSRTLRVNYRTSHQIRSQADGLLGLEVSDVDGNVESRKGTISLFNGAEPAIESFDSPEEEAAAVARWLRGRVQEGLQAQEIAVFVRAEEQLDRAGDAVEQAGLPYSILDDRLAAQGKVSISTMHLAKGLEYRAVVVMACDDEVLPLQQRIETVSDDSELQEVYDTERHLLYVACTRARDYLYVTSGDEPSEFLQDLV